MQHVSSVSVPDDCRVVAISAACQLPGHLNAVNAVGVREAALHAIVARQPISEGGGSGGSSNIALVAFIILILTLLFPFTLLVVIGERYHAIDLIAAHELSAAQRMARTHSKTTEQINANERTDVSRRGAGYSENGGRDECWVASSSSASYLLFVGLAIRCRVNTWIG